MQVQDKKGKNIFPRPPHPWSLFIVFILFSCTKYANYKIGESGGPTLDQVDVMVDQAKVIEWEFGLFGKTELSKGFYANVKIHPLSEEAILDLYRNRSVDSWVVAVKKIDGSGRAEPLGYIYYPLVMQETAEGKDKEEETLNGNGSKTEGEIRVNIINSFNFSVYYSAAAFRDTSVSYVSCPPAGLNKAITQLEMKPSGVSDTEFKIGESGSLPLDPQQSEFMAIVLPGGSSLEGEYHLSLALFSSKDRMVYSNFVEAYQYINVSKEVEKHLPGCR